MLTVDDILVSVVHIGDLIKIKSSHNPNVDTNCQYFVIRVSNNIATIARRVVNSFKPTAMKRSEDVYTIDISRDKFQQLDFKNTDPDNTCIGLDSCVLATLSSGETFPGRVTYSAPYELKQFSLRAGCSSQILQSYTDQFTEGSVIVSLEDGSKLDLISEREYQAKLQSPIYKEADYKVGGTDKHGQIVGWTCLQTSNSDSIKKIYYIIDSDDELDKVDSKYVNFNSSQQAITDNSYAGVDMKNMVQADILNYFSQQPSKYKYFNFDDRYEYDLKEILQMTGHSGDKTNTTGNTTYDLPTEDEMLNAYSTSMFKEFCKLNDITFTPRLFHDKFLSELYEYIKDIVWQYLPERKELNRWCQHSYY